MPRHTKTTSTVLAVAGLSLAAMIVVHPNLELKLTGKRGTAAVHTVAVERDQHSERTTATADIKPTIKARFGKLPMYFEPNRGQITATGSRNPDFVSRGRGYTLLVSAQGSTLALSKVEPKVEATARNHTATVGMRLMHANPNARASGEAPLPGKSHYLLGNREQWRTDVPHFGRVRYEQVYPGIDLVYYGREQQLEYDFEVAPGGDPAQIQMAFDGTQGLRVDDSGDLRIAADGGELRMHRPLAFQPTSDGRRQRIDARYAVLPGKRVAIQVAAFDRRRALIIDPVVSYATYLGGSDRDSGTAVAVDSWGDVYVAGTTLSANLPARGLQATNSGRGDVYVTKLNADGTAILYTTYLGGTGEDAADGLAVDAGGNAYIAGTTTSTDFPVSAAVRATSAGGQDAFVAKLAADGASLGYATYVGGHGADGARAIAVDYEGNAWVAGATASDDFPVHNALQARRAGSGSADASDAFLAAFGPDGSMRSATYLGGSGADGARAIAIEAGGGVWVAGRTESPDFPVVQPLRATPAGGSDAFAARVSADGSQLLYATYLGGSGADEANAIVADAGGNAFVAGVTHSADFPVANAVQPACGLDASGHCTADAFIARLKPDGSLPWYSTYFGGSGQDQAEAIALEAAGNAYIVGTTNSPDLPVRNAVQAACAPANGADACSRDAFIAVVAASGSSLEYASYLGGSAEEGAAAAALDTAGHLYVVGTTSSANWRTTSALQPAFGGLSDAFVVKIAGLPAYDAARATKGRGLRAAAITCTIVFQGFFSTAWENPSNWDLGRLPGPTDNVCIPADAPIILSELQPLAATTDGPTPKAAVPLVVDLGSGTHSINAMESLGILSINGGSLSIAAASTAATLNLNGGTLTGGGALDITGTMGWNGGTMSGLGSTSIISTAGCTIAGTSDKFLVQRTLNNAGSVVWTGTGNFGFDTNATINNLASGVFAIQNDQTTYDACCGAGAGIFNNSGAFRKTLGAGTTAIQSVVFNNTGSVDVQSGAITLNAGGTSSGSFTAQAGKTLNFGGGTHSLDAASSVTGAGTIGFSSDIVNIAGTYSVSGTTVINGGTPTFNSDSSTFDATLGSGTLGGSAIFTVSGTMNWSGGTMAGAGTTVLASGSILNVTGASDKILVQRTLNQAGTATWSGTGNFGFDSNAVLNNQAGASFEVQNDQITYDACCGAGAGTFNNSGTFRKSTATGTTSINSVVFDNSGAVDIQSGSVSLNAGGTSIGSFAVTGGAVLNFGGGSHTLSGASSVSGGGTVGFSGGTTSISGTYVVSGAAATTQINGGTTAFEGSASSTKLTLSSGTLSGSGTMAVSGTLDWLGGTMAGAGATDLAAGSVLNITGSSDKILVQRTINQGGTATWTGTGNFGFDANAVFHNQTGSLFVVQNNQITYDACCGAGAGTFINAGTFRKNTATGTTSINSVVFDNSGAVDIQSGAVSLNAGGTSTGSFAAAGGAVLNFGGGTHNLNAGSGVSGAGTAGFSGGTTNVAGSYALATTTVNGGTVNFNAPAATTDGTLSSGVMGGTASVAVSGVFNWTGGTMSGSGSTDFAASATLVLSGTSDKILVQRTVNNSGTATWSGTGNFGFDLNSIFNNLAGGSFTVENGQITYDACCGAGAGTFNNASIFTKTSTGTTSINSVVFNNTGAVDVQGGTLNLNAGGTSSGAFSADAGATLNFGGGTHDLSAASALGAAGTIGFSGGTVNIAGTYAVAGLTQINGGSANFNAVASTAGGSLSSGTLGGSASLAVTGTFAWTAGTMAGTGSTELIPGSTLAISGNSDKILVQRTVNNSGTATWTGTGNWGFDTNAVFNNVAGGVFEVQNDQITYDACCGAGAGSFNNAGAFRKVTATGTTSFNSVAFNNSGTAEAQTGTVTFNAGGTSTGDFAAAAGATLNFGGGTHNLNAGSTVSAPGTIGFSGGTTSIAGNYGVDGTTRVNGGTVNFDAPSLTANGVLSSGTLGGSSNLGVTGTFDWSGGQMTGTGSTQFTSTAVLTISGAADKTLNQRTINHSGSATWTGTGNWGFDTSAVFNNLGGATFEIQNDQQTYDACCGAGAGTFNNVGTFRKTTATGNTTLQSVPFSNSGSVEVLTGSVAFTAGGVSSSGFAVSAGATVIFNGSIFTLNSGAGFSGAGTVQVSGGTVDVTTAIAAERMTLSNGTLTGAGALAISAVMNWTGGVMSGAGTTDIAAGATLNVSGAADKNLTQRTLNNSGTTIWTGTGNWGFDTNSVFNNLAGATFEIQNNQQTYDACCGTGAGTFNNVGTFRKTTATGSSLFQSVPFNHSGSVDIQTGNVTMNSGGASSAAFDIASGASLTFSGGTYTLNSGSSFTGAGVMQITGATVNVAASTAAQNFLESNGTLTGAGALTVNGALTWTGGIMSGAGSTTVASTGTLSLSGAADKTLVQRTLNNSGSATWTGTGNWGFDLNGTFNNLASGIFEVQNDQQTYDACCGTGAGTFSNAGIFRKATGTATTTFQSVPFSNSAGVELQSGVVAFAAGFTQSAGNTLLAGGNMSAGGTVNINGGLLGGSGSIAANVSSSGIVAPGMSAGGISITGNYTQGATGALSVELGGTAAGTQYDTLTVSGTASLNGILNVSLIGGFTPAAGDTFVILTAGSRLGDFATKNGLTQGSVQLTPVLTLITYTLSASTASNPVPVLSALDPTSAIAGDAAFTLTINGAGFVNGAAVQWNGSSRTTTFVNSGQVTASIPATDIASPGSAEITVVNPAPGGGVSNALTFPVLGTYVVGDGFPAGGDLATTFGDGVLNNLDLLNALRAVTGVEGFVPPACSDRFDALDAHPPDADSVRGGNQVLNNFDLITTLGRVVNLDTSRPARLSFGGVCPAGGLQALSRPAGEQARTTSARMEFGAPRRMGQQLAIPIYIEARQELDLAALSFSVTLTGAARRARLAFTAGDLGAPTLADFEVPGTAAIAWLNGVRLPAARQVLLGYLAAPAEFASGLRLNRVSGNEVETGAEVTIVAPGGLPLPGEPGRPEREPLRQ